MALAGCLMGIVRVAWHVVGVRNMGGRSKAGLPIACGLAFALVLTWLDPIAREVVLVFAPFASAVLCAIAFQLLADEESMPPEYDQAGYLTPSMHTLLFFYLLVFCLSTGLFSVGAERGVVSIAVVVAFALVIAFAVSKKPWRTAIGDSAKIYLPLCILLCFCMVAGETIVTHVAASAAFCAALFQMCSNVTFLENIAAKFKADTISLLSTGRFAPTLGMGTGFALAYILVVVPLPFWAPFAVVAMVAAAVVFVYALLPFNHGNVMIGGVINDVDEGIVPILGEAGESAEEAFAREVDRIADSYALSPRECEVFELLVRGHNTTFIAEQLFISTSTVKTHCFRIYQKLGVHSKQEIIELLNRSHD